MLMLLRIFGRNFVIWDKSANIKFIRPARTTLYAKYLISENFIESIRTEVAPTGKCTRSLTLELKDKDEKVYAIIERIVDAADKNFYQQKKGSTQKAKF